MLQTSSDWLGWLLASPWYSFRAPIGQQSASSFAWLVAYFPRVAFALGVFSITQISKLPGGQLRLCLCTGGGRPEACSLLAKGCTLAAGA